MFIREYMNYNENKNFIYFGYFRVINIKVWLYIFLEYICVYMIYNYIFYKINVWYIKVYYYILI